MVALMIVLLKIVLLMTVLLMTLLLIIIKLMRIIIMKLKKKKQSYKNMWNQRIESCYQLQKTPIQLQLDYFIPHLPTFF